MCMDAFSKLCLETALSVDTFISCAYFRNASPAVKQLLSAEYQNNWQKFKIYKNDMINDVRRHPCDFGSSEASSEYFLEQTTFTEKSVQTERGRICTSNVFKVYK